MKAYIVPVAGTAPDPAAIGAWCADNLARFKLPRYVEFLEDRVDKNDSRS